MKHQPVRRSLHALLISGVFLGATASFATDLDLTTDGATGAIGVASFEQTDAHSGTGLIDPFVRLQANGDEQGFNTDHSPLNGDLADVKPGAWTHSLRITELVPGDRAGVFSVRFLLDINQRGSHPLLSLDELKVFTAPDPDISTNASLFAQNLLYDMGAGNRVLLDSSLNSGSGSGDMFFYLPYSLFMGLDSQYLYLYSKLGASGGDYATNGGFEEWAHITFVTPVEDATWSGVKAIFH